MDYIQIPQLPSYQLSALQDEALFEVCFWDGTQFVSQKITGAVIKNAAAGGAVWGDITGILAEQTDLQLALDDKFDVPNGNIGQYINGMGHLIDFPEIPAPQVNSDWAATGGVSEILNKPLSLPPSGSASGDLAGTYPSPTIKPSVALTGTPTATTASLAVEGNEIITASWFLQKILEYIPTNIPGVSPTEKARGWVATNNSTTVQALLGYINNSTGSVFALSILPTFAVPLPRLRYYTTAAAANSRVSTYGSTSTAFQNLKSGFRFQAMFTPSDQSTGGVEWYVPLARQFVGLSDSPAPLGITSTDSVQSLLNIIGVGSDAGDANLHLFHNSDSGNAQKTDLGPQFPANKTSAVNFPSVYYVEFYSYLATLQVNWQVTNLLTMAKVSGTITNKLPPQLSPLIPQAVRTSGGTSQNVSMDVGCLILSSLY